MGAERDAPRALRRAAAIARAAADARQTEGAQATAHKKPRRLQAGVFSPHPPTVSAPGYPNYPTRSPYTEEPAYQFQSLHCCNDTLWYSIHLEPTCEPFSYAFGYNLTATGVNSMCFPSEDGNDIMIKCPASGFGDVHMRLYASSSNCTSERFLSVEYPNCRSSECVSASLPPLA